LKQFLALPEARCLPIATFITSAGAAQFVAVDLWRDPAPWLLVTFSVFVVNIRHVMMGASLSRHIGHFQPRVRSLAMSLMVDEVWAMAEREALSKPLTCSYYLGLGIPLWINWVAATAIGVMLGRELNDPAVFGFDFAFAALYIAILAGFWKGPVTGAVLGTSTTVAALSKLMVPGAWYIAIGGLAGVVMAYFAESEGTADGH
jgi:predicted branched-subunit amino acid permease